MAHLRSSVLVGLALLMIGRDLARAANVLAGFASGDITPPLNQEMAGFGPALDRRATGIHDPLLAHAMVLEADRKRVAVVDCDVVGVTLDLTHQVLTLVEAGTVIPSQLILVGATHNHSGPAIPKWADWGARDEDYLSGLPQKIARVLIAASKNLQPVEGIAETREDPGGPLEQAQRVLEFKHGDKVAGFIVNYSVHNVICSELMHAYTADLTGLGIARVLRDYPGAKGCSNLARTSFPTGWPGCTRNDGRWTARRGGVESGMESGHPGIRRTTAGGSGSRRRQARGNKQSRPLAGGEGGVVLGSPDEPLAREGGFRGHARNGGKSFFMHWFVSEPL